MSGTHAVASGAASRPGAAAQLIQRKRVRDTSTSREQPDEALDPFELEADRAAEEAMRSGAPGEPSGAAAVVRGRVTPGTGRSAAASASVSAVLASPGQPLTPEARRSFESRFGHDFSRVRIHSGALASTSAQEIGARAFTSGHHIVLGGGSSAETADRKLLAHELAHVVQQQDLNTTGLGVQRKPGPTAPLDTPPTFEGRILSADELRKSKERSAAFNFTGQSEANVLDRPDPVAGTKLAKLAAGRRVNVVRIVTAPTVYQGSGTWVEGGAGWYEVEAPDEPKAKGFVLGVFVGPKPVPSKKADEPAKETPPTTEPPKKEPLKVALPPAPDGLKRVDAAIKLLTVQRDRYKADPKDEKIHGYVKAILKFLDGTVTESKLYAAIPGNDYSARNARTQCGEALARVRSLESAFRGGGPPFLDDERAWKSPIGAMTMARRHLARIIDYRRPVPLKDGWHMVITEDGTVIGYFYIETGVWKILDVDGKVVEAGEAGLEHPLLDPIDLAAGGIAGLIRGVAVGAIESGLSTLARRAAPRIVATAIAVDAGLDMAIPGVLGRIAPRALIMAEQMSAASVETVMKSASTSLPKAAVTQVVEKEGSAALNVVTGAARGSVVTTPERVAASTVVSGTGTRVAVGTAGSTVASQVPGATTVASQVPGATTVASQVPGAATVRTGGLEGVFRKLATGKDQKMFTDQEMTTTWVSEHPDLAGLRAALQDAGVTVVEGSGEMGAASADVRFVKVSGPEASFWRAEIRYQPRAVLQDIWHELNHLLDFRAGKVPPSYSIVAEDASRFAALRASTTEVLMKTGADAAPKVAARPVTELGEIQARKYVAEMRNHLRDIEELLHAKDSAYVENAHKAVASYRNLLKSMVETGNVRGARVLEAAERDALKAYIKRYVSEQFPELPAAFDHEFAPQKFWDFVK